MTRTYMVVYERIAEDNWGGWAPDVDGAVGAGDSLELARQSLIEGIGFMLEDLLERGLSIPEPSSTSIDFSEIGSTSAPRQFVVEWLKVTTPEKPSYSTMKIVQAA